MRAVPCDIVSSSNQASMAGAPQGPPSCQSLLDWCDNHGGRARLSCSEAHSCVQSVYWMSCASPWKLSVLTGVALLHFFVALTPTAWCNLVFFQKQQGRPVHHLYLWPGFLQMILQMYVTGVRPGTHVCSSVAMGNAQKVPTYLWSYALITLFVCDKT